MCDLCEENGIPGCKHSFTKKLHEHKAVNYCFVVLDRNMKIRYEQVYTGENAARHFLKVLVEIQDRLAEICEEFKEMDFSEEDKVSFCLLFLNKKYLITI